jgi:hypothetical protein
MQQSEHTTSLHEIRDFLGRHGGAPPAWSDPATPLDALYRLLKERREDPLFWADLADLTRRLEDARLRGDLAVAGGLEPARVDQLLADLRENLPVNGDGPRNVRAWVGSGVGLAAVAGFVLLGASLGCPTTALCPEAGDAGIADDEQTVFCSLVEIIDSAEINESAKTDLIDCLPNLNAEDREDLLDEFENASEDELVELLMEMAATNDCDGGGDDDTTFTDDDDH